MIFRGGEPPLNYSVELRGGAMGNLMSPIMYNNGDLR
jgi:hypothetical protein